MTMFGSRLIRWLGVALSGMIAVVWSSGCCRGPSDDPDSTQEPEVAAIEQKPRKVAVLMSPEFAETASMEANSDAWYDTVFMYCTLRTNGFEDRDIYVLYAKGYDGFLVATDPEVWTPVSGATSGPHLYYEPPYCEAPTFAANAASTPKEITDFSTLHPNGHPFLNGRCLPQKLLECLATGCDAGQVSTIFDRPGEAIEKLDTDDFLLVWWRGHGAADVKTDGTEHALFSFSTGHSVSSIDVLQWLAAVDVKARLLLFETCNSSCATGGVDLTVSPTVLLTSAGCSETANNLYKPDVHHAVWSYWAAGGLLGTLPNGVSTTIADTTGSLQTVLLDPGGPVQGTYLEAQKATKALFTNQNPEIKDADLVAPTIEIDADKPAG
jgi:hypothetical protein